MARRAMVGMAVIAGVAVAGCGGDDGGGDELGHGEDYSVVGALGELPAALDTGEDVYIVTGDLSLASDAADLERPDDLDDTEAVADWIMPLTGGPVDTDDPEAGPVMFMPLGEVFNTRQAVQVREFHDELGWSVLDAESFVEFNLPPSRFSVISGPFDGDTLDSELTDLGDGLVTTGDGDDLEQNVSDQRPSDMLGRPVRLARDGDRIMASLTTPLAEEWVGGLDETLADDEDLSNLAGALDDADVFSAIITRPEAGFPDLPIGPGDEEDDVDIDAVREELEERMASLPAPFHTVGIGWGADDDGSVATVVYQHASEDIADDNATVLEEIFTDGVSFATARPLSDLYELVDVEADGTLVVVTLRPGLEGHPVTIYSALHQRDVPFLHS